VGENKPLDLEWLSKSLNDRDFDNTPSTEAIEQKWQPETPIERTELKDANTNLPSPVYFERKPAKRLFKHGLRKEELKTLVSELPDEHTDIYVVATGRGRKVGGKDIVQSFGFGSFLEFVVDEFGDGCIVDFSTWSMNKDHAWMLLEMLDSGKVQRLRMLCDRSLETRKLEIMGILKQGLAKFEGSILKMFRNHSKIYCIANVDQTRFCTITGSANLSGNPRAENYVLSTSPELYHHFKTHFFDVMFSVNDDGG
jgi:hypothetical protein